jgi:hypothetical protein
MCNRSTLEDGTLKKKKGSCHVLRDDAHATAASERRATSVARGRKVLLTDDKHLCRTHDNLVIAYTVVVSLLDD